jgi:hypothetical protein
MQLSSYNSINKGEDDQELQPLQEDEVYEDSGGEDNGGDGGTGFIHVLSERFVRTERVLSEQFTPLVRTVSEGMQTLAHPPFVLSERALDLDVDRHKSFPSAGKCDRSKAITLCAVLD